MPYYKNLRAAGLNLLHQYHTGIVCNLHEHSMNYKLATYRNRYQQCLTSCIKHCPHQAFFFTEKGHWTRNICEVVSDTVWLLFYSLAALLQFQHNPTPQNRNISCWPYSQILFGQKSHLSTRLYAYMIVSEEAKTIYLFIITSF